MPEVNLNMGKQPNVKAEMQAEEWYDLLPIEKKLIGYSLCLGILLLIIFIISFKML